MTADGIVHFSQIGEGNVAVPTVAIENFVHVASIELAGILR